ncbi:MAG: helix-turn-helix domain-containing protein [Clostridia bacterium]|nr:helix-turn-helix domain-containing protein [Clostridia bacterium]MBQ3870997.1 helix-turn-helix domain-containing protein [Clostridia bacterium]
MLYYKIDVVKALKEKGFTLRQLKTEKTLSGSTVDKIYAGTVLSTAGIDQLCALLCCQPGDIIAYKPDDK